MDEQQKRLTPAQQRMLADIQRGPRVYNGRARPVVEALVAAGLVEAEYELTPHANGIGMRFTQEITVRKL